MKSGWFWGGRGLLMAVCLILPVELVGAHETPVARGARKAPMCVACHQADGNGLEPGRDTAWPRLAGLDAGYLVRQLEAFKEGSRLNAEMKPFATILNHDQIADVSAYFASLPPRRPPLPDYATPQLLAAGEQLAIKGDSSRSIPACITCHGPDNRGNGAAYPGIAGQHAGYLVKRLVAREGEQAVLAQAHPFAQLLDEQTVRGVSAWLASQAP